MIRLRKYIAEGIGTFALVFVGCGSIIVSTVEGNALGHVGVSAVFGLIVMTMIYSFGNVSGAHFNPAVTLGFYAANRICTKSMLFYIAFQIAGAILASLCLNVLFNNAESFGATYPAGTQAQSFTLEMILTFLLMTVVLNVSTGHKEKGMMAGIAIGGYITLAALFGGPVSGASMNPARSIGPAVISGDLQHLWIYIAAPVLGSVLAVPVFKFIQGVRLNRAAEKEPSQK